jgi:aryl-alcohol dehydrogenase-like predicted oxidoreductase
VLEDEQVLAGLRELRAQGVAIGLTVTGPDQPATIERATDAGAFDTVQATWNLLEPSAGPALTRAHDAGMGVIVKEALANGRLTAQGGEPRLVDAAARAGVAPDALALAAALAQPFADVVLSGAVTTRQLAANLAAAGVAWTPELRAALAPMAMAPDAYWTRRSGMRWT